MDATRSTCKSSGVVRLALFLVAAFALVACGGGGSDDAGKGGKADGSAPAGAAPTSEQLLQAVSATVPGFTSSDIRAVPIGASATFASTATTASGANVLVLVQASACDPFICGKLDPAAYQSAEAQRSLKSALPTAHIENPELHWEFGAIELAPGKTGLFTYAVSYLESKDASGGTTRISANAYRAWFHDGRSLIAMDVFSRGGQSARSAADLQSNMSRSDAEAAAKTIFGGVYPALAK